jgi:hypothetical protein
MSTRSFIFFAVLTVVIAPSVLADETFSTSRDPLKWPFSQNSIWNTPIGSDAEYLPADIPAVTEFCPRAASYVTL